MGDFLEIFPLNYPIVTYADSKPPSSQIGTMPRENSRSVLQRGQSGISIFGAVPVESLPEDRGGGLSLSLSLSLSL